MSLINYRRRRFSPYLDLAENMYRSYSRYRSRAQAERPRPRPVSIPRPVPFNIRQYTRRMIKRNVEKKHCAIGMTDASINHLTWNYTAPLQYIVEGLDNNQRIGDTINDPYLVFAISYSHLPTTHWQSSILRILVVATDLEYANTAGSWVSTPVSGGKFDNLLAGAFHASFSPVDTNDYKVVYDRRIKSNRTLTFTDGPSVTHTIRCKLGAKAVYKEITIGGVSYNKFKNYYILLGVSNEGSLNTDVAGRVQASGFVYYRDA